MEIDLDLLPDFSEEAKDNLEKIYHVLTGFISSDDKEEDVNAVYRAVHTIKGGAGMFGLLELKEAAHTLETRLAEFKSNLTLLSEEAIFEIRSSVENLEKLLDDGITKLTHPEEVVQSQGHLNSQSLTQNHTQTEQSRQIGQIDKTQSTPNNHLSHVAEKKSVAVEKKNKEIQSEMIRVPLDRIQRSYDVTSEVFLIRNQMAHLLEMESKKMRVRDEVFLKWEILDNSLRQRIVELENIVLSMRMTSVKNMFSRMERMIGTYCSEHKKRIQVKVKGVDTELDKKVLDSLADPLTHLIRNAMDHGIEDSSQRAAKGKAEEGIITLEAFIVGNEAILRISDDGKGIHAQQILESARQKGIDTSEIRNDQEALQLIFAPGFSTASEVSDVSGRGVGMDAVKTYVESMGGKIQIITEVDKGTTFSLHLPIGLSVIPAIVVRVSDQLYGIPAYDITQTLTMKRREIFKNENKYLINIDGRYIECFFLSDFFQIERKNDFQGTEYFVCFTKVNGEEKAFIADSIEFNTELIVKTLPERTPCFTYLHGISILATGEPAFVLSLEKLFTHFVHHTNYYSGKGSHVA